ncbi:MAG: hypothetical protein AAF456_01530 [Planctomycetota bacterium]
MNKSRSIILLALVLVSSLWVLREIQIHANYVASFGSGPDVIVGSIPSIRRWGSVGNQTSFSIGTTSCNIGDADMDWISQSNIHPVISQNVYRVKDGRIEQLGMSWLKHGFAVAAGSLCGSCTDPAGNYLAPGCSDPYGSGLNGSQGRLGPRSEVNAATGFFPWPHTDLPSTGTLDGRIIVDNDDIDPSQNPNAVYFVESQYIHPQDAAAGNGLNNASYRRAIVETNPFDIEVDPTSGTVREEPAINAWKAIHPDVQLYNVDIPGDGRVIVGVRVLQTGNGFHTEVAIQNLNSHRSVGSINVDCGSGNVSSPGFTDVDYQHEPYTGTNWAPSMAGSEIEWATDTFANDEDANAIRWNTLYSFWFDSDECPRTLTLGVFRPGTPTEMTIDLCSEITPDSYVVTRGTYSSGGTTELGSSDNMDLSIQRSSVDVQSRTEFEVKGLSPSSDPSYMQITLEGSVFARSTVVQTIELFNYDSSSWEQVNSQNANRFSDTTVTVEPGGDLSRFVEPGTDCIEARVRYQSPSARQQFTSNTDLFTWVIAN